MLSLWPRVVFGVVCVDCCLQSGPEPIATKSPVAQLLFEPPRLSPQALSSFLKKTVFEMFKGRTADDLLMDVPDAKS